MGVSRMRKRMGGGGENERGKAVKMINPGYFVQLQYSPKSRDPRINPCIY
jgi:hypothetical protein